MKYSALVLALALFCAGLPAAEKYSGPRPPKPDVPYLLHGDNLVETEVVQAKEQQRGKNETAFVMPGASSPARTPMAEPIFLFQSDKIRAEDLQLFKMEVKGGNREVVARKKSGARPLRLLVSSLGDNLYRVEVNEGMGLEPGQYSLSPTESNAAFCFEVY
jgi:hypothetical protein